MMNRKISALALPAFLLLGISGMAQAQEAESYVYATYHVCDLAKQERSDEIFAQLDKPILDAAVADGTIASYGLYSHQTGGTWRRVSYTTASSVQALLDAQKKLADKADATNKKLGQEYATICSSHDDYIWRRVAGTAGTASPGGAGFSTYYVCDGTRETQADALVEQVFAPVYDKMVADGKLTSWGWLEHIVGGKYRRLATMNASDLKALMAARADVVKAFTDNAAGDTFTSICDSHSDYIWNVEFSNP